MAVNVLALVALLATQSPQESAPLPETLEDAAARAYWTSLQEQLRTSESARERALGTRIGLGDDPVAGGKALRAAAQAAPTDPLVQMLWATVGARWSGCDSASPCPEQSLAWATAEPDNGLAWMPAFDALGNAGDDASVDADIARIAAAPRFDDHFVEYWQAWRRALAARPMSSLLVAMTMKGAGGETGSPERDRDEVNAIVAMGQASALPLPMLYLSRACRRSDHPQAPASRFENCARIGRGIMRSDSSLMSKMIGSSILRVSGLQDESDRQARRVLEWRNHTVVKLFDERTHPGATAAYFDALASTGSEVRAQELLMARAKVPMEPPAEWQSEWSSK